ncbi:MAG: type II toxin-antitoxin system VapC family toxin, partial [Desulfotomaculales bacterium]
RLSRQLKNWTPSAGREPVNSTVCVDASFALKLVLNEQDSEAVAEKWEEWAKRNIAVIAPHLFFCEVTAVLRNKVWRKELTPAQGKQGLAIILAQGVSPWYARELNLKAREIAEKLLLPAC